MTRVPASILVLTICLTLFLSCTGDEGPAGPAGPAGNSGSGTISGVTPLVALMGRTLDVTISGNNTQWTSGVVVDFGAGVMVTSQVVASPTAIVATIDVPNGVASGTRQVTVTDGNDVATFSGAFTVAGALEVEPPIGTFAQGSILVTALTQTDPSAPWDGALGIPRAFAAGSANGLLQNVTSFSMFATLFIDVTAPTGPTDVIVESGFPTITSCAPAVFTTAARLPIPIGPGTPVIGAPAEPSATVLYQIDVAANQLATVSLTPSLEFPIVALLHDGTFDSPIFTTTNASVVASAPQTYHVVVWDQFGEAPFNFTLGWTSRTVNTESESNDDVANANAYVDTIRANIAPLTDEDYFSVQVNAGETITATVLDPNGGPCQSSAIDPVTEILDTDGTSVLASEDRFTCDTVSFTVATTGTYYVRLKASSFAQGDFSYSLVVDVQ